MTGATSADVEAAVDRLEGIVCRTPVLSSPALDALTGRRALGKVVVHPRG